MKYNLVFLIALYALAETGLACPDEKNCLSCGQDPITKDNTCQYCENSFLDATSKKCNGNVAKLIDNCNSYFPPESFSGGCSGCIFGYYLNDSKDKCIKCSTEGCAFCDHLKCYACFDSIKIKDDGSCDAANKCDAANCSICTSYLPQQCAICLPGYTREQATFQCVKGPDNCLIVQQQGDKECYICNFGFYLLSDGNCKSDSDKSSSKVEKSEFQELGHAKSVKIAMKL